MAARYLVFVHEYNPEIATGNLVLRTDHYDAAKEFIETLSSSYECAEILDNDTAIIHKYTYRKNQWRENGKYVWNSD